MLSSCQAHPLTVSGAGVWQLLHENRHRFVQAVSDTAGTMGSLVLKGPVVLADAGQYGSTAGWSVVLAPIRAAAVLALRAVGRCVAAAARPKTGMLP